MQMQGAFNTKEKHSKGENVKPKRNQFLISLYNALEKSEYDHAMCWDTDGKAFILKNPAFIGEKILMEEFNGMKFTSFIRQLSYYGFKRVSRRANVKVYSHEQFRRDRKDFLKEIKRNHKDIEIKRILTPVLPERFESENSSCVADTMERRVNFLQDELEKMRAENMALRSCVQVLSKKLNEQQSVPRFEGMNTQNPSSNGFYQTFFNPQADNSYPASNQEFSSKQPDFIELYQPDCRVHQTKNARNLIESTDSYQMESPIPEGSEIDNFFNHSHEETFDDGYWREGESQEYDF